MFGTLARRLTAWYVFVAVALVVLLAGGAIFGGLLFYAHGLQEQIHNVVQQVPDVEVRARAAHEDFYAATQRLEGRLARPGVVIRTLSPVPGQKNGEFAIVRMLPRDGARSATAPSPPRREARGIDAGRVATGLLGLRFEERPFMGGSVRVFPDGSRVAAVLETALAVLLGIGLVAGLFAWALGRYITTQALRPLYEVTAALQRFAGRDFTAQPIDVARPGEFSELARTYNAAAAQVEQAFDERQQTEAQMRQFVADAGHELRTPLTIVLGYIDMLKRRAPDDERSRRIFDTIAIEGSRMRTLIDNLVLLAKLDRDDTRPVEPFDLTTLLNSDIVETRRAISPGVRFDLDIAVDANIIGDRAEIHEAVANVVDNAIKYAPGSPVAIAVYAVGTAVEVAVSDRGPGVAPEDRDAIFARFFRGASRGEVEGSGLGLAIAKRAVERAGGTLVLRDTSPAGTTFVIRLRADRVTARVARPLPA
ncbi:MAG: ATP-binding protein [Candidatus Velthaea sp.]